MLDDVITAVSLKRRLDRGGTPEPGEDVLSRAAVAGPEQLQAAEHAAAAATDEWGRRRAADRLELCTRFHAELTKHAEDFVDILAAEGHPRRFAEIETTSILDVTAPESVEFYAQQLVRHVGSGQRRLRLEQKPDGVVGLNPPQNAAATNSAVGVLVLAAGNTMVLRAPQGAPTGVHFLFRELVAPILDELEAPEGTLNIVTSATAATLRHWIESPLVDDIFYFGDSIRGLALAQECVVKGKKPILELAGNDGLVVWRDADLRYAAAALAESFIGSGQVCLVPKFGIVHPAVADEFLGHLLDEVAAIRPAMPDEPGATLSPVMKSDRYFEYLQDALDKGADLLAGGYRVDVEGTRDEAGPFLAPTLLRVDGLDRAEDMLAVREETFFPLLPVVVPAADLPDGMQLGLIIDVLNANPYGLRNSLWSRDPAVIDRFCAEVRTGGLLKINDSHIGTVAPLPAHGGTGLSGGPFGSANFPMLTTTHLQGISVTDGVDPNVAVLGSGSHPVFGSSAER
jgi:acyl-CoA reductase-like NAD-dependent aldehyde dehydrogenase